MKRHASMNRIYRLVWNATLGVMVAVAENAKGRGKSVSGRKLIAAALALTGGALMLPQAMAGPAGGQISAGAGAIAQAGLNTTITQNSQNLAINWQNFSIAANEGVRFNQPNASSVALNRVTSQNPSVILGSLSANGHVFVINPNGVLFGAGAQVDVGGLVASTLGLSDADFMAGKFTFGSAVGQSRSSVVNQGTINIAPGGYVALLAPEARNEGVIIANQGAALLAAGDKVTLNMNNGTLVSYSIDQGAISALAENKQLIQADGGHIVMSAKAADALTTAVVNNTGVIRARTLQNVNGTIRLMGDMKTGTVNVGGTLDASAPTGGNGGFIETSAANVKVANDAKIDTAASMGLNGTWLIDPLDFTIAASGGDMTGAALTTQLANTSVVVSTSPLFPVIDPLTGVQLIDAATGLPVFYDQKAVGVGGGGATAVTINPLTGVLTPIVDPLLNALIYNIAPAPANGIPGSTCTNCTGNINVNDVVSWSANKLTLHADNNINVNVSRDLAGKIIPTLNASGTASLALEYGQGNVNAGNASNYYLNNGAQINLPAGQNFSTKLGSDGVTTPYTVITALGAQGSITGMDLQGMNGTSIDPLTLLPVNNLAGNYVLGANIDATTTNTWTIAALDPATGLPTVVGFTPIGSSISPLATAAGFTGKFDGLGNTITGLTIHTPTTTSLYVGMFGLLGSGSLVQNVNLVSSNVSGSGFVGTLAGANYGGTINNSSSTLASVTGSGVVPVVAVGTAAPMASVGGLVGENISTVATLVAPSAVAAINDSSTSGTVTAQNYPGEAAGGLVGTNMGQVGGTLGIGSSSAVAVGGYGTLGGLVGVNSGAISNSYATGSVTDGAIATGLATTSSVGGLVGYNGTGTLDNAFYDISAVSINGKMGVLSAGGLYNTQYQAWVTTTTATTAAAPITHIAYHPLDIANYANSLPMLPALTGAATAVYGISDGQGMKDMLAFSENAGYSFQLTANVDLASTIPGAAAPGFFVPYFAGSFDGNNLTISNLSLTDATVPGVAMVGMFGQLKAPVQVTLPTGATVIGGSISNLSVTNANITVTSAGGAATPKAIGGLVGYNQGVIGSSSTTGVVNAVNENNVGGLVGDNSGSGQISSSHSTANVTGASNVGGLVGINSAPLSLTLTSNIGNSYSEAGTVTGAGNVGGLVGNNQGNVVTSYSSENVTGTGTGLGANVGGLVGVNNYVKDPVTLVTTSFGTISDSYASGKVTGASYTGGLVGANYGSVTNTYATGAVSGTITGGLIGGAFLGTITNGYWDMTTTGQAASAGGVGYATALMHNQASFAGFDFTSAAPTWVMYEGYTAPLLRSFLTPLTVTAGNVTKVYDGLASIIPTNPGLTYSSPNPLNPLSANAVTPNFNFLLGAATYTGAGSAAGVYALTAPPVDAVLNQPANTGLYSTQQGYLLSYATTPPATLTVTAPPVTVPVVNGLDAVYAGLQLNAGSQSNAALQGTLDQQLSVDCRFDQVEDDCVSFKKHILTVKDGGILLPDDSEHLVLPQQ